MRVNRVNIREFATGERVSLEDVAFLRGHWAGVGWRDGTRNKDAPSASSYRR